MVDAGSNPVVLIAIARWTLTPDWAAAQLIKIIGCRVYNCYLPIKSVKFRSMALRDVGKLVSHTLRVRDRAGSNPVIPIANRSLKVERCPLEGRGCWFESSRFDSQSQLNTVQKLALLCVCGVVATYNLAKVGSRVRISSDAFNTKPVIKEI